MTTPNGPGPPSGWDRFAKSTPWSWLAVAALIAVTGLFYTRDLSSRATMHADEPRWIFAGKTYTDLLFHYRDTRHPLWTHHFATFGSFNPTVGKYVIGFSLNAFGGLPPIDLPENLRPPRKKIARPQVVGGTLRSTKQILGYHHQYNFGRGKDWNAQRGGVPGPTILRAARMGNALSGLLAGFFLFLLTKKLLGGPTGFLAALAFFANPVIDLFSGRATTDIPCLMFVILGLYAFVGALGERRRSWVRLGLYSVLCGLAWGLGISTKLTALPPWVAGLGVACGLLLLALVWRVRKTSSAEPKTGGALSLLPLVLFVAVLPPLLFVGTNPFLYHRTFEPYRNKPNRVAHILSLKDVVGGFDISAKLRKPKHKIRSAWVFLNKESARFHKSRQLSAEMALALVGMAALLWRLFKRRRDREETERTLAFLAISAATWIGTIGWAPFNWQRFFIPLLPFYCVLLAYGIRTVGLGAYNASWYARNNAR